MQKVFMRHLGIHLKEMARMLDFFMEVDDPCRYFFRATREQCTITAHFAIKMCPVWRRKATHLCKRFHCSAPSAPEAVLCDLRIVCNKTGTGNCDLCIILRHPILLSGPSI